MLIKKPTRKQIVQLVTYFSALLFLAPNCLAETETADVTEQERAILNHLKQGVDSVSQPVIIGDKSYIGLFSSKLGPANLELSTSHGLEFTWDNSDFSLRVGGRIYLDLAFYIEDQNDLGDNGLGLRTLQVDMSGKLNQNWFYRLKWGGFTNGGKLDSSGAFLDDAFIRYLGFDNMILTLGQHTEPFKSGTTN